MTTYFTFPIFLCLIGLLGLCVGSFLNVVAHRLPYMLQQEWQHTPSDDPTPFNLLFPRSHCPHCRTPIPFWANIPLLGFMIVRGRCYTCHHPIAWRYPLLEIMCGIVSVWVAGHFGFSWQTAAGLLFSWGSLILAVIDLEHQLLPDDITYPLLWLGLFCSLFFLFTDSQRAILGAITGYLSLWSIAYLYHLLTGKTGMGHGDFKLLAVLGAWCGWQLVPFILLASSLCGTVIGFTLIILKKARRDTPMPFGPYLILAGWLALMMGNEWIARYGQWWR